MLIKVFVCKQKAYLYYFTMILRQNSWYEKWYYLVFIKKIIIRSAGF